MHPISTTVPEPITAADAAAAARVDEDDAVVMAMLPGLITAAREQAEHITGRRYVTTVLRDERDDWPSDGEVLPAAAPSAVSIAWWDGSAWQTLAPEAYVWTATGGGTGTVVAPVLGTSWPALGDRAVPGRVRIDVTCGPTESAPVPECVRLYIRASVAAWVDQPEALADGRLQPNPLFLRLLDAERTWR